MDPIIPLDSFVDLYGSVDLIREEQETSSEEITDNSN
jgi:hypothetical protein